MIRLEIALALALAVAGCSRPDAGARQVATYQCQPSDAGAAQGKGRRLTVLYDARGQQALLSLDGGSVNYLNLVPDVKERLFANAKYAWKSTGDVGQLTDIAEVQVYSCTRAAAGAVVPGAKP
jgi:hypothetical protein